MFKKKDKKESTKSSTAGGTSHYEEKTTVKKSDIGTSITTVRQISSSSVQSYTSELRSYTVSHSKSAGNFPSLLANDRPLSLTAGSSFSGTGTRLFGSSSLGADNRSNPFNPGIATRTKPPIIGSGAACSLLPRSSFNSPATATSGYRSPQNLTTFGSYPMRTRTPVLPSIAAQGAAQSLPLTTDDIVPTYLHTSEKIGKALVINNIKFMRSEEREGAKKDSDDLITLLKKIGFTVEHKSNLKGKEMKKTVATFSKSNFKRYNVSLVVIMSHGNNLILERDRVVSVRGGFTQIAGVDNELLLTDDITDMFAASNCDLSLKGKPKIFIFQCCRGKSDQVVCHDAGTTETHVKEQADMLIAFSTLPGYLSNRDPKKGTWYIQSLCEVFNKYHKDYHVEDMLKIVDAQLGKIHPDYTQTSTYENRGFKRCFLHKDAS